MIIDAIQYPIAITRQGEGIALENILGVPTIGATLEDLGGGKYKVVGTSMDTDCVNGVCPIK